MLLTITNHYSGVIMRGMAFQITAVSIVCSTVCSGADKKTPMLHVTGLCKGKPPVTVGFPHKRPVTQKEFPFDDVIMRKAAKRCLGFCHETMVHDLWCNSYYIYICPGGRFVALALSVGMSGEYDAQRVSQYHDDVIKWKHFPRNWPF